MRTVRGRLNHCEPACGRSVYRGCVSVVDGSLDVLIVASDVNQSNYEIDMTLIEAGQLITSHWTASREIGFYFRPRKFMSLSMGELAYLFLGLD